MPAQNKVIIASAGGRKTTQLIEEAISQESKNVLVTTYTRENTENIINSIISKKSFLPPHITVSTWFGFLFRECARPYQGVILGDLRMRSIAFVPPPNLPLSKSNPRYFFTKGGGIYKDRVSDFAWMCNEKSGGLVIKRLEGVYDSIYIDEMQDLAGWDIDLVDLLFESSIKLIMVGDPRQTTYTTTNSTKNKGKTRKNLSTWIDELRKKGNCQIEERALSYRCNQEICDFADSIFPEFPKTKSLNAEKTDHNGVIIIKRKEVKDYFDKYSPQVLRWNKTVDTIGLPGMNIGLSKGRTFDRVLLFPTKPMKEFIKTSNPALAGDRAMLYVAVTRARSSVAFVID